MSDAKFFRAIEARGWMIEAAEEELGDLSRFNVEGESVVLTVEELAGELVA